jgi:hypothetical protein
MITYMVLFYNMLGQRLLSSAFYKILLKYL